MPCVCARIRMSFSSTTTFNSNYRKKLQNGASEPRAVFFVVADVWSISQAVVVDFEWRSRRTWVCWARGNVCLTA
jgi:hypothetical protein